MKKALITGITGQDGSYLADLLLEKGYEVHGIVRRSNIIWREWLGHLHLSEMYGESLFLHFADLSDLTSFRRILKKVQPNELYHLAGQSHVGLSFEIPEVTSYDAGFSVLSLLEIVRDLNSPVRFFHAASAEIFGAPEEVPQRESTPFRPVSPYGAAKAFASNIVRIYREVHGLFLVNGIMYNHESPRRGENFVTKKICQSASLIAAGKQKDMVMGEINISRDWGHAKDYVNGMWLSLQSEHPDDYIFSTGVSHSLEDVLDIAFSRVNLQWRDFYKLDESLLRPVESASLIGDSSKAREILKWNPEYSFESMIAEMMDHEIEKTKKLVEL